MTEWTKSRSKRCSRFKSGTLSLVYGALAVATALVLLLNVEKLTWVPFSGSVRYLQPSTTPVMTFSIDTGVFALPSNKSGRIFYNRVPKCGSRAFMAVYEKLRTLNGFVFKSSSIYGSFCLPHVSDQEKVVKDFISLPDKVIFDRHVYFIDFEKFSENHPIYINIIRNPLDRLVSWYYFIRFEEGHIRSMSDTRRNMTFDECVAIRKGECVHTPSTHSIIPYFCGHDAMCRNPTDDSLSRAKRNVEQYYQLVGVCEEMDKFIKLVEFGLPDYFAGAHKIYGVKNEDLKNNTRTKRRQSISATSAEYMKHLMKLDFEFYEFVKQRFHNTYFQYFPKHTIL